MKNRIASLILVFAMLMSLCTNAMARDNRIAVQSGGAERFTDVPPGPNPARHWAYDYINTVVGSGLFNGKTPTTFEPSSAMTRSQFVLVMARMEGRSDLEGQVTQTIFPDVATTRRAAGPIAWATQEGFVNGFGDGTFKPDSPITRGQFAALIHRYINYKGYSALKTLSPEPAQFTDASSVPNAFVGDVEYARTHGLLTGYSDGTVRASNPITRAAIAAILARFLDLVRESDYIPLLDYPRPTETNLIIEEVNGANGSTAIVSVMRGDTQVGSSASDAQPGDRVTISHVPQSGYHVTVAAKDSDGYPVTITTDGNTSWFNMPSVVPVTVTVTYAADSGPNTDTTVANPYDPTLKLTVTGETHGTTSVSATRGANGPAVSAGDLQKGDRVIISHIPQTGYEASVIVRDGNGRRIAVTRTSEESSWFEMPAATPVTVKVSYTSKSGGGGGGSSRTYTFPVSATGVPNPTEGGYVYLALTRPNAFDDDFRQNTEALRFNASSTSTSSGSRTIYAVLTPKDGYTFTDEAISVSGGGSTSLLSEFDNGARLYALSAYGASRTETTAVTVTGFFKVASTPTEDKFTWTVSANIDNALVAVYETKPATVTAPTAASAKSATVTADKGATPAAMYLVVAPVSGYQFPADFDDKITVGGFAATVAPDTTVTAEGVRAYTITPNAALNETATTNITAALEATTPVEDKFTWTVSANISNALVAVYETKPATVTAPTAASAKSATVTADKGATPAAMYLVVAPVSGYQFPADFDDKITVGGFAATIAPDTTVTAEGVRAYTITPDAALNADATTNITAALEATTPVEDKFTWTVNANISNALVAVYATKPATVTAPTAASAKSATVTADKGATPAAMYLVVAPVSGYQFPADFDDKITVGGFAATVAPDTTVTAEGVRAYTITPNAALNADATTNITAALEATTPAGQVRWTVEATVNNAFVVVSKTKPAPVTAPTASKTSDFRDVNPGETPAAMYLIVAPVSGYQFPADFDDKIAAVTGFTSVDVAPDTTAEGVRAYTITPNAALNETATTNINANLELAPSVAPSTYTVTVKQTVNGVAVTTQDVPAVKVRSTPAAEKSIVYVEASYQTYYHGYKIESVTLEYSGVSLLLNGTDNPADFYQTYNFVMPAENVTVTVDYSEIPDNTLSYTFRVTADPSEALSGMVVNVGGKTISFPDRVSSDPNWTVSGSDGNWTVSGSMLQSEYDAYWTGGEIPTDGHLPIYLTSAPVAKDGYKFDSAKIDGSAVSQFGADGAQNLLPNTSKSIDVTFKELKSFGYKLTVVGAGTTVKGTFKGDDKVDLPIGGSATTEAITETNSAVIQGEDTKVTVNISSVKNSDPHMIIAAIQVNEQPYTIGEDVEITESGVVDIFVSMRDDRAEPTSFDVEVKSGGSVAISASGGILAQNSEPSKTDLDAAPITITPNQEADKPQRYWVYEGTMVTLTPKPDGTKTHSVTFNDESVYDISRADGYSFQVTKSGLVATVTFGTLKEYRFLAQAPFNSTNPKLTFAKDLHSYTTAFTDGTLTALLYSLNNGQFSVTGTGEVTYNGFTNDFRNTPYTLLTALDYYLSPQNLNEIATLEEKFGDSIGGSLDVNKMMNDQKNTMVTSESTRTTIENQLNTTLTKSSDLEELRNGFDVTLPNGAEKNSVLASVLSDDLRNLNEAEDISVRVDAHVQPILTIAQETADTKDQSIEKQLQSFIKQHLTQDLEISPVSVTPNVKLGYRMVKSDTNPAESYIEIDVSATATFASRPAPNIKKAFSEYADRISKSATATVSVSITANTDDARTLLNAAGLTQDASGAYVVTPTDIYLFDLDKIASGSSDVSSKMSKITGALNQVDAAINDVWDTQLDALMTGNALTVNMGTVLDGALVRTVVQESFLKDAIGELKSRVKSLGDATNTEAAIMALYDKLVSFDKNPETNSGAMIALLNQKGQRITDPALGAIDENGHLIVTLNLEKLLRDTATPGDNTAYERVVDLLMALRDGIATDIRETSEKNGSNATPQSVLSGMIQSQIKERLSVTKWGKPIPGSKMSATERKEVADLLAEFLMSDLNADVDKDIWSKFEAKGYQSVSASIGMNRSALNKLRDSLNVALGGDYDNIAVGAMMEQIVDPLS